MSELLLILAANSAWQESADLRLAELLLAFEGRGEAADLDVLAAEIDALGVAVLEPVVRRLVEDLRDGVASIAVPALVDVLAVRAADVAPLRAAFADPATSPAGRVQIARALADLDDDRSWRPGLRAILADRGAAIDARLGAAGVLFGAADGPALEPLRALVAELPGLPRADRGRIYAFLARANTPETRVLIDEALEAEDPRPGDEPHARLVDEHPLRVSPAPAPREPKKSVAAVADWITMLELAAVAAALVLLFACWLLQRKG